MAEESRVKSGDHGGESSLVITYHMQFKFFVYGLVPYKFVEPIFSLTFYYSAILNSKLCKFSLLKITDLCDIVDQLGFLKFLIKACTVS